jgi:putative pyruvate formate lyase activating enzyme
MRIAALEAHLGEEPPISGVHGSGTVFFSGCSLKCLFCQNYQISRDGLGREWTLEEIVDHLATLREHEGIHNVDFVTPDHFFPHTMAVVSLLRERGIRMPVVYNLSGYQRVESLGLIEGFADIYLPDFKYGDAALAGNLSCAPDYPGVALEAIGEMVRQKGFLDAFGNTDEDRSDPGGIDDAFQPSRKGVLVRHLILPDYVGNSIQALNMLFLEFGGELPISLMSQYAPIHRFPSGSSLNRMVTRDEFGEVVGYAEELGFKNLFVQYPPDGGSGMRPFLPDFHSVNPFPGNRRTRTHGSLRTHEGSTRLD